MKTYTPTAFDRQMLRSFKVSWDGAPATPPEDLQHVDEYLRMVDANESVTRQAHLERQKRLRWRARYKAKCRTLENWRVAAIFFGLAFLVAAVDLISIFRRKS